MKIGIFRTLSILAVALSLAISAHATEIYSIVENSCVIQTGLILNSDQEALTMLNLKGESVRIQRGDIKSLTIFNTIENPIPKIQLSIDSLERLRVISIDSQDQPYLTGWPVRFVEELVIFYDITGKTYVLNFDRMTRVRRPSKEIGSLLKLTGSPANFEMSESLGSCPQLSRGPGPFIRPTRIISDKIQLSEFISSFVAGFESMDSFEERTYLYALPYLYERSTRMGFLSNDAYLEQPKLPEFYFQWSRGRSYRFQSSYKVGFFQMRYAPSVESFFGAATELKSHLFHASFNGNLMALSAGSSYYSKIRDLFSRAPSTTERAHFAPGFNYMALMGVDYGAWSGSFGTYFPTFAVIADNDFREVLSPKGQSIFRVMYTTPKVQVMALFSRGQLGKNDGITDRDIVADSQIGGIGLIDSFSLSYNYLNTDITYRFNSELSAGLQMIVVKGDYREVSPSGANNSFGFDHTTFAANVRHQFGDYVGLTGIVRSYSQKQTFSFETKAHSEPLTRTVFGGVFEFIF